MSKVKLKPCSVCGVMPVFELWASGGTICAIRCNNPDRPDSCDIPFYYSRSNNSDEAIIKALDTSIESDDISGTIGDKVTVTADIKDKNGNPVKNGTAVLTIDGKNYTAEVKDGKATFDNVELPSKNTTATIEYLGNDYYNASSITVDVTVNEEDQNKTDNNTENNTEDNTGDNTQEVASKSVELLATGNPIAMLVLVLLTLVSTISIRRQK